MLSYLFRLNMNNMVIMLHMLSMLHFFPKLPCSNFVDGLSDDKANLSPAKLKLADFGLELSLAI